MAYYPINNEILNKDYVQTTKLNALINYDSKLCNT